MSTTHTQEQITRLMRAKLYRQPLVKYIWDNMDPELCGPVSRQMIGEILAQTADYFDAYPPDPVIVGFPEQL